tara:strand:+ start:139 stop:456 length:318 start_codon:yes stop_codon:yes gene_type:complete
MSDDLVKRLREVDAHEAPTHAEVDMAEAADRIEQLSILLMAQEEATSEVEEYARRHASEVRVLTAERDRLRKELENIVADCEASYPPSHGAIKYAANLALKGETS